MIITTYSKQGDQTYSDYLLNICQKRGDMCAKDVSYVGSVGSLMVDTGLE
jgi:hypothetical protein